jgi:hypothetical protein
MKAWNLTYDDNEETESSESEQSDPKHDVED